MNFFFLFRLCFADLGFVVVVVVVGWYLVYVFDGDPGEEGWFCEEGGLGCSSLLGIVSLREHFEYPFGLSASVHGGWREKLNGRVSLKFPGKKTRNKIASTSSPHYEVCTSAPPPTTPVEFSKPPSPTAPDGSTPMRIFLSTSLPVAIINSPTLKSFPTASHPKSPASP